MKTYDFKPNLKKVVQNFIPLNWTSTHHKPIVSPEPYFWAKATRNCSELFATYPSPELYFV